MKEQHYNIEPQHDVNERPKERVSLVVMLTDGWIGRAYYVKWSDTFYLSRISNAGPVIKWEYLPDYLQRQEQEESFLQFVTEMGYEPNGDPEIIEGLQKMWEQKSIN